MDTARHERVKAIFLEVCELDADARDAVLDTRCAGLDDGAAIRAEVLSLLGFDEGDDDAPDPTAGTSPSRPFGDVVAKAAADVLSDVDPSAAPLDEGPLPERIGNYRVLGLLGRGGMGVVYRAEQDHPKRVVALKVIRAGLATPRMLRRFEHETEALGRLQHPGIAQIFEAGTAPVDDRDEVPFFALELVEGPTLKDHCARESLGTRQRLELVARIADAVHHAHVKGVVHRDLKPGNILVDAAGQPKILDFGIARVADVDTAATLEASLATDVGQIVGTLPYMSPEQVTGDSEMLDARSDVYALGVIAYELLAGVLPYDIERRPLLDVARVIREEDPKPLSSIQRVFRGDVETLIGKSLEKERDRRYAAASEFAADIRRYLADEPILARPPSTAYQLRKFARRNRPLVAGVALAFAALVVGTIVSTIKYLDEAEARRIADDRSLEAAEVEGFFVDMLRSADPGASGRDARVVDMLDASSAEIDARFPERPSVRAILHRTVGVTYANLGQTTDARGHLRSAVALYDEALARNPADADLALAALDARLNLARLLVVDEDWTAARPMLEEAAAASAELLGPEHENTLLARVHLAEADLRSGDHDAARAAFDELAALAHETLGDDSPVTLEAEDGRGVLLSLAGRHAEAAEVHGRVLETRAELYGATALETLESMHNRAVAFVGLNDFGEARLLVDLCLAERARRLGVDHAATRRTRALKGLVQFGQGELDAAETSLRAIVEGEQAARDAPLDRADALNNLANVLLVQRRPDEAAPLFAEAVPILEGLRGDDDLVTLTAMVGLAQTDVFGGRLDEARARVDHILAYTADAREGPGLRTRRLALSLGAMIASRRGDPEASVTTYRLLVDALTGDDAAALDRLVALTNLGSSLRKAGRPAEGVAPLTEAVDGLASALGSPRHPNVLAATRQLALTLAAADRPADAAALQRELVDAHRAISGDDAVKTAVARCELAKSLLATDHAALVDEALTLARHADTVLSASTPGSSDAERAAEVLADATARSGG